MIGQHMIDTLESNQKKVFDFHSYMQSPIDGQVNFTTNQIAVRKWRKIITL